MYSLIQLTVNEWLKLFKKKSFFVAFVIMTLIPAGQVWVIKKLMEQDEIGVVEFIQSVVDISGGGSIFVFICMIYMASIVSSEHRYGTIKLLLIRAHSRSKILASKYIITMVYMLVLMLFTVLISAIFTMSFFGTELDGSFLDILKSVAYTLVYTMIYTTIVFMLSVLTKSTGATIGITFVLMFMEGLITMLLAKYDFAKFILFFHTDLKMYEQGTPMIEGMTLGFSVTVIIVYLLVMLGTSLYVFNKRDVA